MCILSQFAWIELDSSEWAIIHPVAKHYLSPPVRRQDFWNHELFVRQSSQLINDLWGHLVEYGVDVTQAVVQFRRMIASFNEVAVDLPA